MRLVNRHQRPLPADILIECSLFRRGFHRRTTDRGDSGRRTAATTPSDGRITPTETTAAPRRHPRCHVIKSPRHKRDRRTLYRGSRLDRLRCARHRDPTNQGKAEELSEIPLTDILEPLSLTNQIAYQTLLSITTSLVPALTLRRLIGLFQSLTACHRISPYDVERKQMRQRLTAFEASLSGRTLPSEKASVHSLA